MPALFWIYWLGGMAVATAIGAWTIRKYRDTYGYPILVSILTAYLIVNTALASRRVEVYVFGIRLVLLTGTLLWPFTSQIVDMINEVYGGKKAYAAAAFSYIGRFIFLIVVAFGAYLTPIWDPQQEAWWQSYFGAVPRIVFAAAISYAVVQFLNIYVFVKFKRKTLPTETDLWSRIKGGFARAWGGDFFGDLFDGPVFYLLAFAGTMDWPTLWALIISATVSKFIVNQVDLPYYVLFRVLLGEKVKKDY